MRNFTVLEAEQRSPEWFAARVGRLTGSVASDMLAALKGNGEAYQRRDLRARLVCERLTGVPQEDGYVNAVMQRGIDKEPEARLAYEALTGELVEQTGFLTHTELMVGCSLDGHVGDFSGIVELKCPKSATHLSYLKAGCVPSHHLPQILHNLYVTGAEWCDFVSFDDRFPEGLQLFVHRVPRVELDILAYEKCALKFLSEVDIEVEQLKARLAAA
jgi:hypothetical protein